MERLIHSGIITPNRRSIVYTLQHILQTDFIIGGLFDLELRGLSHYLPNSNKVTVPLYGNDRLPHWTKEIVKIDVFVKHTRTSLFTEIQVASLPDLYAEKVVFH